MFLFGPEKNKKKKNAFTAQEIPFTIAVLLLSVNQHRETSNLVKFVEDSLRVSAVRVQGFGIVYGDDWLFKLLEPCPHKPSEDEGVPLHTQPLPRTPLVQLFLHRFGKLLYHVFLAVTEVTHAHTFLCIKCLDLL